MTSLIGQTISHYKILERLGAGGMGEVYKAQDTKLKRTVALKFLPLALTADPEAKERFIHEAQAASALDHPNICTVYEINETNDGQMFMAMACYDGETLKKKIERGPFPIDQAVGIVIQLTLGLAKAHESGIVHRDIKPANIIVTKDGAAKMLDFGLAKLSGRTLLTKTGTTLGTVAYMSPEQARSEAVDNRTDVWSLGVTFYEMLTGHRPFESDYEQALVYSILNEEPTPLGELRKDVPETLERIVQRAIRKSPQERYQTAGELLADLEAFRAGSRLAKRTQRLPVRKRNLVFLAGTAVVILIAAGLTLFLPPSSPKLTSLAVLPFVNVAKNPEIEYLCDGLAEALTDQISSLPQLEKVTAFNGVLYFKGRDLPPTEIGKQLGVGTLLITRLSQHGDSLQLAMELLDTRENRHLWSGRFQEASTQVSRIVPSVFLSLATALNLRGTSSQPKPVSEVSEAYRLFLRSRHHYQKGTVDDVRKSIKYCQEALSRDPSFALAYSGLAEGYVQLIGTDFGWDHIRDSAMIAARKAIELDNNLPQGYASSGLVKLHDLDLKGAEQDFLRALALNRFYSEGYHYYAHLLSWRGEFDKGIENMQKAIDLTPTSSMNQVCMGALYIYARRWKQAEIQLERTKQLDSTSRDDADFSLFTTMLLQGRLKEAGTIALRLASIPGSEPTLLEWRLARIAAMGGRREEALARLHRLEDLAKKEKGVRGEQFDPVSFARIYASLGMKEKAFEWLEQSFVQSSIFRMHLNTAPEFDTLRGDPRFSVFLRRAGFLE